jgi:hypothetical protein
MAFKFLGDRRRSVPGTVSLQNQVSEVEVEDMR